MPPTQTISLAEQFMPFARKLARGLKACFPTAEAEELESDAMLGLVEAEASGRFNPALGGFAAFAAPHILGAMKDGLRHAFKAARIDLAEIPELLIDYKSIGPDRECELQEEAEFIRQNLSVLPYERSTSIRLRSGSISEQCHISRSAASNRIRRARKLIIEQHSAENPCVN